MTQSASPNSLTSLAAGGSTAKRYEYSAWRWACWTSGVLRSRQTALSRSSQWVADHARTSSKACHQP